MSTRYFNILFIGLLSACSSKYTPNILTIPFSEQFTPSRPDYNKSENWAVLPDKKDNADRVPQCKGCLDEQASAEVDVFFIHPTLYLDTTPKSHQWNADVNDEVINKKVDESTILYQASAFNGAGKIYAPRYREAHLAAYYTKDKPTADMAFELAYSDVKRAFEFYMEHWNNNRPVIIASHSQGTTHAIRLLQEFFDGKPLMNQLVAAYLIGIPVYDTLYSHLKICADSSETGCFVTWRTFAQKYFPPGYVIPKHDAVCTNPLTWRNDDKYAPYKLNKGGILKNFKHIIPHLSDAQVLDGVVRIDKPHFFLTPFFKYTNYHIVDYNLFYMNIRENAQLRVKKFLERGKQSINK
ncbi:MAG: DUF3089 domain-containing protein [Bacteroidota bacterium]